MASSEEDSSEPEQIPVKSRDKTAKSGRPAWPQALLVILVAAVIAGAGGTYYLLDQKIQEYRATTEALMSGWEARIGAAESGGRSNAELMQQRIEALEQRVKTNTSLAQQLNASAISQIEANKLGLQQVKNNFRAPLTALNSRINQQQGAISNIENSVSTVTADTRQQTRALDTRVKSLEKIRTQSPNSMVALVGLARAVEDSVPFQNQLAAFRRVSGTTVSIKLRNASRAGVPSWSDLRTRFPPLARAVLDAERQKNTSDVSFLRKIWNSLANLISIRRAGEIGGTSLAARVSQAEARLGNGNYADAVAAIRALAPNVPESLNNWLVTAERRLQIEAEINQYLSAFLQTDN